MLNPFLILTSVRMEVSLQLLLRLQLEKLEIWPRGPRGDTLFQASILLFIYFFLFVWRLLVTSWVDEVAPILTLPHPRLLEWGQPNNEDDGLSECHWPGYALNRIHQLSLVYGPSIRPYLEHTNLTAPNLFDLQIY